MNNLPFRRNHYVPEWYQKRFFVNGMKERKFYYLDLKPDKKSIGNGKTYTRKAIRRLGPPSAFSETDLYTTKFGTWESTEIEEKFFGKIDREGEKGVEYFSKLEHPSVNSDALHALLIYMSIQKIRTPKGLQFLEHLANTKNRNQILVVMQNLQQMYCAIWTESVWAIADASQSNTKFILSDHPVTVYNQNCPPQSRYCRDFNDPEITLTGTYTIFPLSIDKILIFTNLSWVRNPYEKPTKLRPNPEMFRHTFFSFLDIQVGRQLSEVEVNQINYIIKERGYRYVASPVKNWLYPEEIIPTTHWSKLGEGLLLMPDPRGVTFSGPVTFGYDNNLSESFDEYGRRPWEQQYCANNRSDVEWKTSNRFKGRFARLVGPKRRGRSYTHSKLDNEEDSPEFHKYHLSLEKKF